MTSGLLSRDWKITSPHTRNENGLKMVQNAFCTQAPFRASYLLVLNSFTVKTNGNYGQIPFNLCLGHDPCTSHTGMPWCQINEYNEI